MNFNFFLEIKKSNELLMFYELCFKIKLIPRDQYGRLAICPNMKVEITVRIGMAAENSNSNLCPTNRSATTVPSPQSIKVNLIYILKIISSYSVKVWCRK